ncbi:hypothetical protein NHH03_25585 [Stieleria sp. TO1_6]|uniref:hypothetical protein n=1 Tax=Stieleria tagensis TaxID=2956795 RepID=UPI00209AB412|nr:hypothetical protein [Stieleria tagensis]MCO8125134.1 hypothetical protein [Stieleria tagensis]
MKIDVFDRRPPDPFAAALHEFESQFHYPLGSDASFRISHGDDYTRFFRAIGDARCFVASDAGMVHGVISVALCDLHQPGGEVVRGVYFCDLKIKPAGIGRGRVLIKLFAAVKDWIGQQAQFGFGVVMDGTSQIPTDYTGRLGIERFAPLAQLSILRIPSDIRTQSISDPGSKTTRVAVDAVTRMHVDLMPDTYANQSGDPGLRSQIEPIGLQQENDRSGRVTACGILEDTRRAKRLLVEPAGEMISAHLSCFSYRNFRDGYDLIQAARTECFHQRIPALFVAVDESDREKFVERIADDRLVVAPAIVYGYAVPDHPIKVGRWSINTSEI